MAVRAKKALQPEGLSVVVPRLSFIWRAGRRIGADRELPRLFLPESAVSTRSINHLFFSIHRRRTKYRLAQRFRHRTRRTDN
jgi:hypothetical protein